MKNYINFPKKWQNDFWCIPKKAKISNKCLVDCPTQLFCTWFCCSMTKLKEQSR